MSWFGADEERSEMTNGYIPDLNPAPTGTLGNSNMMNIPKDDTALNLIECTSNQGSIRTWFRTYSPTSPRTRQGCRSSTGASETSNGKPAKHGES